MITHAHGDHARWGSKSYLCSVDGAGVLRTRMGPGAAISTLSYGETIALNGVRVSLHPAGHIIGAQSSVLPAFGDFTGFADVDATLDDRVFVIAGDRVMKVDGTST